MVPGPAGGLGPRPDPQSLFVFQISRSFFSSITDLQVQQKLLGLLFDLASQNPSPLLASRVSRVFKGVRMPCRPHQTASDLLVWFYVDL